MRCEDCLPLLEELLDGEAAGRDALVARAHLAACAPCSERYESLRREQEAYAGFLRGVEPGPWARTRLMSRIEAEPVPGSGGILSPWRRVGAAPFAWVAARRTAVATAFAVLVVALLVASASLFGGRDAARQEVAAADPTARHADERPARAVPDAVPDGARAAATRGDDVATPVVAAVTRAGAVRPASRGRRPRFEAESRPPAQAARFAEAAAFDRESASLRLTARDAGTDGLDRAAARHFEQARLLLLAFKNMPRPEAGDAEVAYEKGQSRVLAGRNALLRKEAGSARNRPVETLLERVEPLLLDIAHLPERASAAEVETVRRRIANGSVLFTLRAQSYDAVASAGARRD
jgi:hypothetical protein